MSPATAKPPQQARGQRRVVQILDAAEQEVLRHGVDGLRMDAVARAAATAPGSLYQFFPGKPSLVAALAGRHDTALALLAVETATTLQADPPDGISAMALAFLGPFVRYYEAHPVYLVLAEAARRSAPLALSQQESDHAVARALATCLRPWVAPEALERLDLACKLMVETGHAAIAASREADPAGRPGWIDELECLVAAYAQTLARGVQIINA